LKGLEKISRFLRLMGNHEADYLKREIETADKLLKLGGLLIMISSFWNELQQAYESIDETKYQN